MVSIVCHDNMAVIIHCNTHWINELSWVWSPVTKLTQEPSIRIEHLPLQQTKQNHKKTPATSTLEKKTTGTTTMTMGTTSQKIAKTKLNSNARNQYNIVIFNKKEVWLVFEHGE